VGLPLPGVVRTRPRLFSSAGIGVAVTAGLAVLAPWPPARRVVVGWDIGVALYLTLALLMMLRSDVAGIRSRAAEEDEGRFAILALTVFAALASIAAIFVELGGLARSSRQAPQVGLAIVTIALSWAFVHTIFALHYAHEFYDQTDGRGLAFPGDTPEPDYWDFVYFALVIGMTCQVSDVAITSPEIRRTAAVHGMVAFIFNTAVLALTINLAATAI
jgi:uncharacterized membrane protein